MYKSQLNFSYSLSFDILMCMYLKSIEIYGFKSFAKKSELLFTSPISSIVGPNGSGKSNIAEAFRFVLGEQSMKSLRGKKGEDMIWNGSTEVPKAGKASVKVVFDNTHRFLPLDFSEVILERVVHRDSMNEYYINGSQVRLKDCIELLAAAHIGASGHHIISQGEADRIISATPRERKIMIEEALGLKIYQYKKTESIRKLDKTEEHIKEVESLRREIAPHIRFLKKQVEKVEKAVELKKELLALSQEYLSKEKAFIEERKNLEHKRKAEIEAGLATIDESIAHSKRILESEKEKDVKRDELLALEKEIELIRERKSTVLKDGGRIEGEIASHMRIVAKQKELARSQAWKTVELRAVEDLHIQVTSLLEHIERESDESERRKKIDAVRSMLRAFVDIHKDMVDTSAIAEAEQEIARLTEEKDRIAGDTARIVEEEKALEARYTALRVSIEKEKDTNREVEKRMFELLHNRQQLENDMRIIERDMQVLTVREEDYTRNVSELSFLLGRDVLAFESMHFPTDQDASLQEARVRQIEKIKLRLEDAPDVGGETVKEYESTLERDQFLEKELGDLKKSAESLRALITDLEQKIVSEFKEGVTKINTQFTDYFSRMFGGGEAMLSVIAEVKRKKKSDIDDIFEQSSEEEEATEEGIEIEVSLPRKKIRGLMMLSGGERALTSIALLFAIAQVNPPPFIILDETDAALDEANSRKYGDMIEHLSKVSQLIVITHNRETMSRAGSLFGITMGQGGVSKLLSVSFEEASVVAK